MEAIRFLDDVDAHALRRTTSAAKRITRYAQRMLIENGLADAVKFFHLDALSSAVRLKIDFDVTLTEVASGLYRMLGRRLAGYESAQSRQLFRYFLNTPAEVEITDKRVEVTLPKRAGIAVQLKRAFPDHALAIEQSLDERMKEREFSGGVPVIFGRTLAHTANRERATSH